MPDISTHPSARALALFGHGKLSEAQATTVAAHLERCAECREAVANLSADSFLEKLQGGRTGSTLLPPAAPPQVAPVAAAPDLPPELANHPKFRVIRELGRGGMGVIYLAEHRVLEKQVALKVIKPAVLDNPNALARFQAESRAAARLDHPNIARAYDADQAGDLHFLVMEYVEGVNLARLREKKGPLSVTAACHCACQAALGLQHAYEQGMVHRDIKPHNLMVTPKGQIKVLDFGLARLQSERRMSPRLTQLESFMGTPEYVAPEQASDARQADTRSDIYSLGCTLYALVAGRPPFVGESLTQIVLAHIEKEPVPLHELRPEVPAALSAVVAKMLAKDPAKRFQRPAEVAQALAPFARVPTKGGAAGNGEAVRVAGDGTRLGGATSREIVPTKPGPRPPRRGGEPAENDSPFADLDHAAPASRKAEAARASAKDEKRSWWQRAKLMTMATGAVFALALAAVVVYKVNLKAPNTEPLREAKIDQPATHNEEQQQTEKAAPQQVSSTEPEKAPTKPESAEALFKRGLALEAQRRFKESEEAHREALRLQPDYAPAHNGLGSALANQGRHKEAEAEFREFIRLRPNYPEVHLNLGHALAAQDQHKEAEAAYREAIRLKSDFPEAHVGLGDALREQGQYEKAETAYSEAIRHKPDFALAHGRLAVLLLDHLGRPRQAETELREAIRQQHDVVAWHRGLGACLVDQGRGREAEAAFRKALDLKQDYVAGHYGVAIALQLQGRCGAAEAAYRKAIDLKLDYAEAHCNLGGVLEDQGRFSEALEERRQGHELGSKLPEWNYPSGDWLRHCERLVELERRLPAILGGTAKPADASEQAGFAEVCRCKQLNVTASRLYADAFAADSKLSADPHHKHRAICSAVLAAAGQGEDAKQLTSDERVTLRQRALSWFNEVLEYYSKRVKEDQPAIKRNVRRFVSRWQEDVDLASVREQLALDKLPEDERTPWRRFWDEVAGVLKQIDEGK
jgi:tetratricopeptide (TPR) repeat protein/tRNA A-37 threonylcarbamoyl transferase component Bud32